jgi:murein L,D-transpeptidase YcbB/YkuD
LRQIAVNLERLRWLPRNLPAERVWVNIADAQLALYRDDQPVFTTRVVVGQSSWQTPELQTSIESLLYNPPWNVPPSIAAVEILPKLEKDPDYLSRHRMVMRPNGAIQQLPGTGTALGQLKFELPNRFDVYLHDTPLKHLFSRDNRRQSHGCVRVQNPRELAALLLQQPVAAINQGIALGYTNRRMLPAPIAVFLVYQTAFVGADGGIEFRPDVYRRDEEIWRRLHPAGQAPVAQREPAGQIRG